MIRRDSGTDDMRNDTFLAIFSGKNESLEKAGVGTGSSERAAASSALNSYFARKAVEERDKVSTFIEANPKPDAYQEHRSELRANLSQALFHKRVAVSKTQIEAMINAAVDGATSVKITGTKVDGSPGWSRLVEPVKVYSRAGSYGSTIKYVDVKDVLTDELRTFRLDLIERAETID